MEDALHTFWSCPANEFIDDDTLVSTQSLIPFAEAQAGDTPCLWFRGLLPSSYTSLKEEHEPPETDDIVLVNRTHHPISWGSNTYYGDASGGTLTSVPTLRRIGIGLACVDPQGVLLFGVHARLPGSVQTVPRGELYAIVLLARLAIPLAIIDFFTDNLGVHDAFNKGPLFCSRTANCDLFAELFEIIHDKALLFTVRWMPSHLLEEPTKCVFAGCSLMDLRGNDKADKLAVEAARRAQLPPHVCAKVIFNLRLVQRIQLRLTTILTNLPDRPKPKKAKVEKVRLQELIDRSSHLNC